MANPFLGELRIVSYPFPPKGWALCNGQLLPIDQNLALFSILGNTYGGDGRVTFGLPDLRGRVPLGRGGGALGEKGGSETERLTLAQLPGHTHPVRASTVQASLDGPGGNYWAGSASGTRYTTGAPNAVMDPSVVTRVGANQPHSNMQPFLVLNVIIALDGVYPTTT